MIVVGRVHDSIFLTFVVLKIHIIASCQEREIILCQSYDLTVRGLRVIVVARSFTVTLVLRTIHMRPQRLGGVSCVPVIINTKQKQKPTQERKATFLEMRESRLLGKPEDIDQPLNKLVTWRKALEHTFFVHLSFLLGITVLVPAVMRTHVFWCGCMCASLHVGA